MDFEQLSRSVYRDVEEVIGSGRVANYIPALAKIDPEKFGMAIIGCDGETAVIGDADEPFSIQSVSKVFTLSLALGQICGNMSGASHPGLPSTRLFSWNVKRGFLAIRSSMRGRWW